MSGIYIKNMEMPKTCCKCKMMVYNPELVWGDGGIERTGAWVCLLTGELIDNTEYEKHCPLVPVHEHGRLIDADALFDFILNIYKTAQGDKRKAYRDVLDTIVAAGDVIPAEEGE